jgi:hypothetical protein
VFNKLPDTDLLRDWYSRWRGYGKAIQPVGLKPDVIIATRVGRHHLAEIPDFPTDGLFALHLG